MRITKVSLKNYKSFGNENNFIYLDDITAILGKNESGKSNLISGLSEINFLKPSYLARKQNKLLADPVQIEAVLEFEKDDEIEPAYKVKTIVTFENGRFCSFSGGLFNLFSEGGKYSECQASLLEKLKKLDLKTDIPMKKEFSEWLSLPFGVFALDSHLEKAKRFKTWVMSKINESASFAEEIDFMIGELEHVLHLLPTVFFYEPHEYKNRYTLDEIAKIKEVANQNLNQLLSVAGIDPADLKKAMQSSTDSGRRCIIKAEIKEKLENLTKEFNKFYNNQIKILFDIENDYFDLLISDSPYPMALSDRSTGLKWYFDLFVQLKSQDLLDHKLLILLDEPGIHLHINAQQSLLLLLNKLAEKNQVVYTTHSPFMIDSEKLSGIRLIENINGISFIYNHVHSAPITNASKMEILSPVMQAIGFAEKFNIAPDHVKLNVLVEGLSDYYYLLGAAKLYRIPIKFSLIPCNGVNNIHLIASILFGWGYDFKSVMDFDNQGYQESRNLERLGLKNNVNYYTYNLEPINKELMSQNPFTVESLFSQDELEKIKAPDKIKMSLNFYDLALSDGIVLCAETQQRFLKLFSALGLLQMSSE